MMPSPVIANIPFRDVKYDIRQFGVHGTSYRQYGSDPVLQIFSDGSASFLERGRLHTRTFTQTQRVLTVVEAYGGIEDLIGVLPPSGTPVSGLPLIFPARRGAEGKELPVLVPLVHIAGTRARVALGTPGPDRPLIQGVAARADSVEVYVDWETNHASHLLQFATPGFHVGVRAQWTVDPTPLPYVGVELQFPDQAHSLLAALRLTLFFDQQFVKAAARVASPYSAATFLREAPHVYNAINGEDVFGHPYDHPAFLAQVTMVAERIGAIGGLQRHYGI